MTNLTTKQTDKTVINIRSISEVDIRKAIEKWRCNQDIIDSAKQLEEITPAATWAVQERNNTLNLILKELGL